MTPTEQFSDVMYANRVFGAIEVRQHTRQLAAELGFPESVLGPVPQVLPPTPPRIEVRTEAERERSRLDWLIAERARARIAIALPDAHHHFVVTSVA